MAYSNYTISGAKTAIDPTSADTMAKLQQMAFQREQQEWARQQQQMKMRAANQAFGNTGGGGRAITLGAPGGGGGGASVTIGGMGGGGGGGALSGAVESSLRVGAPGMGGAGDRLYPQDMMRRTMSGAAAAGRAAGDRAANQISRSYAGRGFGVGPGSAMARQVVAPEQARARLLADMAGQNAGRQAVIQMGGQEGQYQSNALSNALALARLAQEGQMGQQRLALDAQQMALQNQLAMLNAFG